MDQEVLVNLTDEIRIQTVAFLTINIFNNRAMLNLDSDLTMKEAADIAGDIYESARKVARAL